ncbi:MAG: hypothetical protein DYG89_12860 [Caldilinea sp. CFX5]|nr:hypothetical protein [Caldilinea sp. CFX5]
MSMIVSLLHYQQAHPGHCLPACAKMVLAKLGKEYTEARLNKVLGTNDAGTPSSASTKLIQLGFSVTYTALSTRELSLVLAEGIPVIIFIQTMFYEHWETDTPHAVVVVGMEPGQRFWIHDPDLPTGPTAVSWNGLLATWQEFDFYGAVIRHK